MSKNRRANGICGYDNTTSSDSTTTGSGEMFQCNYCNKKVNGGTTIQGVFYCPMCASIINANNAKAQDYMEEIKKLIQDAPKLPDIPVIPNIPNNYNWNIPECCKCCGNHPSNGGSGVCHCTLPYMTQPYIKYGTSTTTTWTTTTCTGNNVGKDNTNTT